MYGKQEKADEIERLTREQREISQKESDVQSQIDLLKEFSIQKNQVLADTINPHFKHFQFQFLDYTQDGEPVEVCRMIVDGIDYFNGLNHSDQILCNIDLVAGLQELNGLKLPIWIDDAESVNEERFPKMEQQVIYLKVSDNELKVEGQKLGTVDCKIRPITFDEAREYTDITPNNDLNDWYWTLSPWSTEERGWSKSLTVVSPSGVIGHGNCFFGSGVRPVCILKSNIFVSKVEE